MDSHDISINGPIQSKAFAPSPTTTPDIKRCTVPGEQGKSTLKRPQFQLELYGGSGQVRTEQPSVRGKNIDIII